jgi:hypothetical protein
MPETTDATTGDTSPNSDTNGIAAEYVASALDVYQNNGRSGPPPSAGPGHRTDRDRADLLVRDLLTDLMHYADLRGIDFDAALAGGRFAYVEERTEAATYRPGALVQQTGTAARQANQAGLPRRGVVTDLLLTPGEPAIYKVRCPSEARSHRFAATDLEPAAPFEQVTTRHQVVHTPLAAEQALVETTARITLCDKHDLPADHTDIEDHHTLLGALTNWSGRTEEQLTGPLTPRITQEMWRLEAERITSGPPTHRIRRTDPDQLVAQDIPFSLAAGVPTPNEHTAASRPAEQTRGRGRHRAGR